MAEQSGVASAPWRRGPGGKTVYDANGVMVADCGARTGQPSIAAQVANARAIGALPELLAEAEKAAEEIVGLANATDLLTEAEMPGFLTRVADGLLAVAKKAKGGAS